MFSPSTILIVLIAFSVLRVWLKWQLSRPISEPSKNPAKCRLIIANELQHEDQHNALSGHEARAIPNDHRRIAFGIDNAFTRTNDIHASLFVDKARSLINLSPKDWADVSEFARATTSHWIEHGFPNLDHTCGKGGCKQKNLDCGRINVASLAQSLSLKVVLWLMFGRRDQHQTSDQSILRLAQSINRVWISSKQNLTENDIQRFEDDAELQISLYNVFGTHERPEDNPLNLILPSFETMWRIVLLAFLEIRFVAGKDIPVWWQTMITFARQPTKDQFESYSNSINPRDAQGTLNAKCIVNELLRLYAPTKRIHRAYQWHQGIGASHEIVSGDIEGCHLRSDIWGSDAERFITSSLGRGCAHIELPIRTCTWYNVRYGYLNKLRTFTQDLYLILLHSKIHLFSIY
ncbi:Cytochrome P450 [Penicillium sp. IBT 31633x]|nr:Cytochrome P450 [Penicillium sp. IBT 31633x]